MRAAKRKPPAPVKVTPGGKSKTEYLFMGEDASPREAAVKRMAAGGAKVPSVKRPRRMVAP